MAHGTMKLLEKEDIFLALIKLDLACKAQNTKADLMLLGGAAIQLFLESLGIEFRATSDIDVNIVEATNLEEIRSILLENEIDIVGGVMDLPPMEDFVADTNFKVELGLTNINVYVPSPELLACSKIFSIREKDLIDLKNSELLNQCNKEKLLEMVDEYKDYALNLHNPDLNFHQLECILKEKGI